jgi:hypothetical protein
MWSNKQPWWSRKSKENQTDHSHYKDWCVIRVAVDRRYDPNSWGIDFTYGYKAVAKLNAPTMYGSDGKMSKAIEVDNLTKHEAHCVAKGLNFLDKE